MSEDFICYEIAGFLQHLDKFSIQPTLWFHVANEIANSKHPAFGAKLKKMGKKAGIADYIFMYKNGSFMVEVKVPGGKQTESQKLIQQECITKEIPYYLVYSLEDLINILKEKRIIEKDI